MPKTKISEFSATPANNTDIDSINISEGCAPSGINDAIRELMAQLKDWQSGTSNDPYVVGSSGSLTLNQGTANGVAYLNGSKVVTSGSALTFDGTIFQTSGTIRASSGANQGFEAGWSSGASYVYAQAYDRTASTFQPFALTASNIQFLVGSSPSEQMRLTSTGLGIGTSSPSYKLDINKGSSGVIQRWNTGSVSMLVEADHSVNGNWFLSPQGTATFNVKTNGSTRLTVDSSGNLGLGVTPSAWGSVWKAQQFQVGGFIASQTNANDIIHVGTNAFANSSNAWTYINTAASTRYQQYQGAHQWFTAASGTAGNAITFTQAMTLDNTGALLVGSTANDWGSFGGISQFKKDQNSPSLLTVTNQNSGSSGSAGILLAAYGNSWVNSIGTTAKNTNALTWALDASASPPSVKMTLNTTGNLGLGVTPSAWGSFIPTAIELPNGVGFSSQSNAPVAHFSANAYYDGSWRYKATGVAARYSLGSDTHAWSTAASGTAGNAITFTQAMTLDASGNLLMGTTSTTGSATNSKQLVGGVFSTVSGSVSAATSTATTIFTSPTDNVAAWFVTVNVSTASTAYAATYVINAQGGSATVATQIYKGANISVTMSGYNVQVTQTSGVTQTVSYSAIRIA